MRVAVFGAGYWGINYIRELGKYVEFVIEPNAERAEVVRKKYGVAVYPDLPEVYFDAAVVTTPPEHHVRIAKPILASGRKVLIEKPLAMSVNEAKELQPYAENCMAALVYLFHPTVETLRKEASARIEFKQLSHICSRRTNAGPVRPWQTAMHDLTPHDISIFNYVLESSPKWVRAAGNNDWTFLNLGYELTSGETYDAICYVSWHGGEKIRRIELVYTPEHSERFVFDDVSIVLSITPLRRMLDSFMNGQWEKSTFDDGMAVMQVLQSAEKSLAMGGREVEL